MDGVAVIPPIVRYGGFCIISVFFSHVRVSGVLGLCVCQAHGIPNGRKTQMMRITRLQNEHGAKVC